MLSPDAPINAVKQEFGRRLERAMSAKGWNQSELARRASSFVPGKRMIRDNVSKYIRGKVLPGPKHLKALSQALDVLPDELLPSRGASLHRDEHPALDVRDLRDGNAWLRINQSVPWPIAVKVIELLKARPESI